MRVVLQQVVSRVVVAGSEGVVLFDPSLSLLLRLSVSLACCLLLPTAGAAGLLVQGTHSAVAERVSRPTFRIS